MFKIGNIEIKGKAVLAPMAGVCNEAFREICKEHGADLIFTEMVSDKAIVYGNERSLKMTEVSKKEHPVGLQIFGADLETFVKAAIYADKNSECDFIDINMGCPVPKIAMSCQAGSALLKDPEKIYQIVKATVDAVSKPITVKLRLGWDHNSINCVEVSKLIEKAGGKCITLHARTRNQFYTGNADWSWIKKVKDNVNIPVIGNGDVRTPEDAKRMLEETGCDAVMVARSAKGNPWIFKQINDYLETGKYDNNKPFDKIFETIKDHTNRLIKLKGERTAILEMRTHASDYVTGLSDAKDFRKRLVNSSNKAELFSILEEYEKYLLEVKN
jgi:tRNA-dihydrouridine synthase B